MSEPERLKTLYLKRAVAFIDSELELLKEKHLHPERFVKQAAEPFKSVLHINPKSCRLGIIGFVEIVVAIFLSGIVKGADGQPAPLKHIARAFEQMFNISFGNIYDKQDALFRRKRFNRTKALDFLREIFIMEYDKRNNW